MSLCIHASMRLMQDKLILQRSNKFMQYLFASVMLCAFLSLPIAANAADEDDKKLPIPRFVSLKSNDVNIRVGPGTRYSISWVFKRANYPVEIIQEFDQWREIRDHEGAIGWVHKNMLQGCYVRKSIHDTKTAILLCVEQSRNINKCCDELLSWEMFLLRWATHKDSISNYSRYTVAHYLHV